MSSHPNSSSYYKARTQFSNDDSLDQLPDDLETAQAIIESLTRQLKAHDDVTSNLLLLQKRIQHTHKRTQDAMHMLEDRLDNIEATWTKELENQHKRWLEKYNHLMKEAENNRILSGIASKTLATSSSDNKNVKISKQQLENFNRRAMKINEGINELKKVASCTKNFDEKLCFDKHKIKDIDNRLKTLTKKEQKLNAELTKQMNIHFRKSIIELRKDLSEKSSSGIHEVTDAYQQTIENLDSALQKMEQIRSASEMKSIKCSIQTTPTIDEIDEITIVMRRFLAKLRVQAESLMSNKNLSKSTNLLETMTDSGSSNSSDITNYNTTPSNISHSTSTGSSISSAHSEFMSLKSDAGNKGAMKSTEKTEQNINQKK